MLSLLEFMSGFDFVTTLRNLFVTMTRNVRTFYVPLDCGWCGKSIHDLLKTYGIEMLTWDACYGEQFFSVPDEQAGTAYSVLISYGIPLLHEMEAQG